MAGSGKHRRDVSTRGCRRRDSDRAPVEAHARTGIAGGARRLPHRQRL